MVFSSGHGRHSYSTSQISCLDAETITDSGMEFLEEHGVDPRIEGKAGEPGRKQEGGQPMEPNPRSRN